MPTLYGTLISLCSFFVYSYSVDSFLFTLHTVLSLPFSCLVSTLISFLVRLSYRHLATPSPCFAHNHLWSCGLAEYRVYFPYFPSLMACCCDSCVGCGPLYATKRGDGDDGAGEILRVRQAAASL